MSITYTMRGDALARLLRTVLTMIDKPRSDREAPVFNRQWQDVVCIMGRSRFFAGSAEVTAYNGYLLTALDAGPAMGDDAGEAIWLHRDDARAVIGRARRAGAGRLRLSRRGGDVIIAPARRGDGDVMRLKDHRDGYYEAKHYAAWYPKLHDPGEVTGRLTMGAAGELLELLRREREKLLPLLRHQPRYYHCYLRLCPSAAKGGCIMFRGRRETHYMLFMDGHVLHTGKRFALPVTRTDGATSGKRHLTSAVEMMRLLQTLDPDDEVVIEITGEKERGVWCVHQNEPGRISLLQTLHLA